MSYDIFPPLFKVITRWILGGLVNKLNLLT